MSKKYIISLGVIVGLLLIIIYSKQDKRFDLPELPRWQGDVTAITVIKGKKMIQLTSEKGKWYINKEKYPADVTVVNAVINQMRDLKLADHISSKGYYERYDLTGDNVLHIIVKQGDKEVRNVLIGKKSASSRHTFLKLNERHDVYQVNGTFDRLISDDINQYRDKDIINISANAVEQFSITYKKKRFIFSKIKQEEIIDKSAKKQDDNGDSKKSVTQTKWICAGYEKMQLDKRAVDAILNSIIYLKAVSYPDKQASELKNPVCILNIKDNSQMYDVKIYNNEGNKYFSISSHNPYVFFLDEYTVKKFFIDSINNFVVKQVK